MADNLIVGLTDPAARDRLLVGGKAANLSLLASEFRVPPGFCVTEAAHRAWVEGLEGDVRRQVAQAYGSLGSKLGAGDPAVAVRSSATDEDGSESSFAGQYETFLNVVGAEAVQKAVVGCWESARSPRAVEYRRSRGLSGHSGVAVLVQALVSSDVSGIVFSVNPVTADRSEVVVNASWGLGESVVGGTVTPDSWVVRRSDVSVVRNDCADKKVMTIRDDAGTREVAVPRLLRTRPCLNEAQVLEAARLAIDLEARMGWPVDLECSWSDGSLNLLQCRPVTTVATKRGNLEG